MNKDFAELVNTNESYMKEVIKLVDVEPIDLGAVVGGLFKGGNFQYPYFIGFSQKLTVNGQTYNGVLVRCLKNLRPKVATETLENLTKPFVRVGYEGFAIYDLHSLRLSLPATTNPFIFAFTSAWTGHRFTLKWICHVNGRIGFGKSASLAMMNCGAEPEVSSKFLHLVKAGLV